MTAFYLKYRPRKISELDLPYIRQALQEIVRSGRIPHAFLLVGPRGSGKTSAARIIAKTVNCERLQTTDYSRQKNNKKSSSQKTVDDRHVFEPCNKCDQCKAIINNSSLDIIEIDAASHRGIDDARSLRETVKLSPAEAKKKVYIIDECHMLTTEASNALLKTLEEPPKHAIFILATTEGHKVLDTIKSRCTVLNFRKAKPDEVKNSLKKAVKGEKIKITDEALDEIANNVDGSFREAHKILEQLSYSKGEINRERVIQALLLALVSPASLVEALARYELRQALEEVGKAAEGGVNLQSYAKSIVDLLRDSLLAQYGVGNGSTIQFSSFAELERAVRIFSDAASKVPSAVVPQLPLELAVVKFCSKNELSKDNLSQSSSGKQTARKRAKPHSLSNKPTITRDSILSQEQLEKCWEEILEKASPHNFSIEALLRAARPSAFTGKKLVIEVFYKFHKERLESNQFRSIIEQVASEVFGNDIELACQLAKPGKRATDLVNVSSQVDDDIVRVAEEVFGQSQKKFSSSR